MQMKHVSMYPKEGNYRHGGDACLRRAQQAI